MQWPSNIKALLGVGCDSAAPTKDVDLMLTSKARRRPQAKARIFSPELYCGDNPAQIYFIFYLSRVPPMLHKR